MNPLFLGLLLVGMLGVPLPFALRWWRRRRARRAWLALAPKLELSFAADGAHRLLSGRYQGHSVEVLLSPDGTAQMRMKARADLPSGLHLSRQEAGTHRLQLRGLRDIQVGDESLDAAFIIQGSNPAAVIRLLREPDLREALLALVADNPRAVLTENEVVAPIGYPVREEPCRRALRTLAQVAFTLERSAGQLTQQEVLAREQVPQAPVEPEPAKSQVGRTLSDKDIRDEYGRRTSLYMRLALFPLVVGWGLMVLFGPKGLLGHAGTPWGTVGFGLLLGGLVGGVYGDLKLLRCPACDETFTWWTRRNPSRDENLKAEVKARGTRSVEALWLVACPYCKARLR
ncbi:hypothetical protein JQX13_20205 [Archangium violaceum]|uniref:hypothetical protein n=1 Tax=Archangium violaceum TaxID=83451 RepID=UPI00193C6DB1|nr:hypothetical protein [Archangium violaceum]QRK12156.1 hypothetical protein JQX13_20205 [Archangium violaceum]